ncbi:hypothetical protein TNIN_284461 [Trichonephila inaurata madagascariensis]|uniref:Uncharacterized protein n=1 Tax=Trichonephila inaurata madagascariensis TaxID=2747483 RepID=A0A8X6X9G8_9ARAC|nr:hypothetical protein TNIN_284461 [Trichonephila inaurata madagascariensis]
MFTWVGKANVQPPKVFSPISPSMLGQKPQGWGSGFTPNLSHKRPGRCLLRVFNLSRTRFLILTFVVFRFSFSRNDRRTFIIPTRLIKSGSFQASFPIPLLSCEYLRLKHLCRVYKYNVA